MGLLDPTEMGTGARLVTGWRVSWEAGPPVSPGRFVLTLVLEGDEEYELRPTARDLPGVVGLLRDAARTYFDPDREQLQFMDVRTEPHSPPNAERRDERRARAREAGARVLEREELSERFASLRTRVFALEAGPWAGVAGLYVDPEARALVWEGSLGTEVLDARAVLEEIHGRVIGDKGARLFVGTTLFRASGEALYGVLGEEILEEEHTKWLASGDVAAARYDVASGGWGPPPDDALDYALTARGLGPDRLLGAWRGARQEGSGGFELSLLLPKERAWTPALLEWVVEHHARRRELVGVLDAEQAAREISHAGGHSAVGFA